MMSVADQLRTASVVVIEGRGGIGMTVGVAGIDVTPTDTGKSHEGADDLNSIVMPARGVAYIERGGRVWVLADGPVIPGPAVVYLAQYRDDPTEAQADSLAVVLAVLGDVYGLDAPAPVADTADGDTDPDPIDSEGDTE